MSELGERETRLENKEGSTIHLDTSQKTETNVARGFPAYNAGAAAF